MIVGEGAICPEGRLRAGRVCGCGLNSDLAESRDALRHRAAAGLVADIPSDEVMELTCLLVGSLITGCLCRVL